MGQTPELEDVILGAIEQRLERVFTTMPGRVIDYDKVLRAATVQPLTPYAYINEVGDRVSDTLPILYRVPVVFPGGASGELLFPIKPGDDVVLHFSSASLDKYKSTGHGLDAEDDRRHDLADAIATPGLQSFQGTREGVDDRVALVGDLVCLGEVGADDAVVVESALSAFMDALDIAIAALSANTVAQAALAALKTALTSPPPAGIGGWGPGTSKTKAK